MKLSYFLLGTIGLGVVVSALVPVNAAALSYYRVNLWADADPYGQSNPTLLFDETEGAISATLDTGWRLGSSGSEAKAHSTANLATGELKVYAGARGAGGYSNYGSASASAWFRDSLSFDLPDGMSSATVTVSLAVDGSFAYYQASNSSTYADASLWFWESGVSGFLIREDDSIWDAYGSTGTGVPHTLSGDVIVEEGKEYVFHASLVAGVNTLNPDNLSYFDFLSTGALDIDLPVGVTFTSGSGVLLPEPTTALLLVCGLVGLATAGRRRSFH